MKKDKTGIEKVKAFDKKWERLESDNILLKRIAAYFFEGLIGMVVLMICTETRWQLIHLAMATIYSWIMWLHLNIYVTTVHEEGKEDVSIYQILEYMPIEPKDIFKVRISYLWKILYKRLILFYVLQLPFIVEQNGITAVNVLYPLFVIGIAGVVVGGSIKHGTCRGVFKYKGK